MKTRDAYQISGEDFNAMRFAGGMGHRILVVGDNLSPSRKYPGIRAEVNSVQSAKKHASIGDRIYRVIGPRRYELLEVVTV